MPKEIKQVATSPSRNQTAVWVATTVIFALLFFLSSVLDMKVKVTFGETTGAPATSNVRTTTPSTTAAPAGGIASQVGGC